MNEITDRAILTALGRQMSNAVQRQSVAAGNLANLDTPDYKARAVAFGDVLDGELDGTASLARTNAGHLGGPPPAGGAESEVDGLPATLHQVTGRADRQLRAVGKWDVVQTSVVPVELMQGFPGG